MPSCVSQPSAVAKTKVRGYVQPINLDSSGKAKKIESTKDVELSVNLYPGKFTIRAQWRIMLVLAVRMP
jgi:hypothetical protein